MQQPNVNSQSLLMMGAAIFVSVTAAVLVSTLVIMSLMRGEIASALSSQVNNEAPATAQTASAGCTVPASEVSTSDGTTTVSAAATSGDDYAAPLMGSVHFAKYVPANTSNSFNNTTNNTVTNNVTNTELNHKTVIKDSFNDNSTKVVVKDNTVNVNSNNNNSTNSGNTTNNTQNNVQTTNNVTTTTNNTVTTNNTTTNVNSNNTTNVNSNNTVENHVLSDNTVVVVPVI